VVRATDLHAGAGTGGAAQRRVPTGLDRAGAPTGAPLPSAERTVMTLEHPTELAAATAPWVVLVDGRSSRSGRSQRPSWWVYLQVVALTLVVLAVVGVVAALLSQQEARRESAVDATRRALVFTKTVVQPSIGDDILTATPQSWEVLDGAVREFVLGEEVVRVKLWDADGQILYSDEPRLVGSHFALDEAELAVLQQGAPPSAKVSDLAEPENRYETETGKLLEVYSRVETPGGEPLLFETYYRYDSANSRFGEIWRGLTLVTWSSLALLLVLLLPVIWRLVTRLRRSQEEREALLVRAAETSTAERRRIAETLHDGVVQDLAATSFVLAGAAGSAGQAGQDALATNLSKASEAVRSSIGGLRSLLVEIYPPSLSATGLEAVLVDLVGGPSTRDLDVTLDLPEESRTQLDRDGQRLVFRVAQECLRNVARHASARHVAVRLSDTGRSIVLSVSDDGIGFVPEQVLSSRSPEQYGLRLMVDDARAAGADLRVRSAPGQGTTWELTVVPR
jgi:two-component system NarL family sensor kinase